MIESESTDSSPKHDLEQGEEIMATNMVYVGFYAKGMINTDHQWKQKWKYIHLLKIYGQNKIWCEILAIIFVFLSLLRPKTAIPVGIVPDHLESSIFFWYLIWPILMVRCGQLIPINFLNTPTAQESQR